jgi:cytidylate kinase
MVTISRQAGADGDEIARLLAEQLNWKLLNNEVLERLLVERGFPKMEIASFKEKRPGLWHRFAYERDRYLNFLKAVLYEFACQGDCVVVGRGGQLIFKDVPGILRVRVVAPLQERVLRVRESFGGDEKRARHALQQADNDRAAFHRFLFHASWDSPDLYDLIINTGIASARTAAGMIRQVLDSKEFAKSKKENSRKLEELLRTQKAVMAILYEQKLPIHFLEIELADGEVTLKGTARDQPSIERCADVAAGIFRGSKIRNEISFEPEYVERMGGLHPAGQG